MPKTILLDPPWQHDHQGVDGCVNDKKDLWKYPTMTHKEMLDMKLEEDAEYCLMWACWPIMERSINLLEHWGFTYKGVYAYFIKTNKYDGRDCKVMGTYTASNSELLLLGLKNRDYYGPLNMTVRHRRMAHSQKPDVFKDMIVRDFEAPFKEYFARTTDFPGWEYHGNQVNTYADQCNERDLKVKRQKFTTYKRNSEARNHLHKCSAQCERVTDKFEILLLEKPLDKYSINMCFRGVCKTRGSDHVLIFKFNNAETIKQDIEKIQTMGFIYRTVFALMCDEDGQVGDIYGVAKYPKTAVRKLRVNFLSQIVKGQTIIEFVNDVFNGKNIVIM